MECKDLQTQGMWSKGLGTPVMSKEEVMAVLRSFGMGKFAGAVMWVLNEVFSMPTQLSINDERLMIVRGCCANLMRLKVNDCLLKLCKAATSGNMTLGMLS